MKNSIKKKNTFFTIISLGLLWGIPSIADSNVGQSKNINDMIKNCCSGNHICNNNELAKIQKWINEKEKESEASPGRTKEGM